MADNRPRPIARPGGVAGTGAAGPAAATSAPLGPPPPPSQQPQVAPLGPPPPPRPLFGKRDAVFRPWPLPSKQPSNIGEFVQRLKFQGIDFRDLNEDKLREQIEKDKIKEEEGKQKKTDGLIKTKTVAKSGPKRDTSHDRPRGLQEMLAKRDEIIMSLEAAVQSGLIAVDFVSLLLSKDRPTQALQTLSPIVRDKAGIGTLSAGRIANAAQAARAIQSQTGGGGGAVGGLSTAEVQALDETTRFNAQRLVEHKLECVGWQLLAMDRASEVLKVGRKRLRAEMRREERYWAEVLAVRDKGWTLSRMPGQRRILRVKFGFSESAPDLRALSFAPLQRVKNGQVALDLSALGAPSAIVITLKNKDPGSGEVVIGRSPLATRLADSASLEARLLEARNTVNAKELWRELSREARIMISHGVAFRDEEIVFPAGANTEGMITIEPLYHRLSSKVSAAEKKKREAEATHDPQLNTIAAGIATSLQLFLAHGHRDHYRQRSSPPALSDSPPPPPVYYMLRPIVANLKYEKAIQHISNYLADVCGILHGVGLEGSRFTLYERPLSMSIPPPKARNQPKQQQQQLQQAPSASEGLCTAFLVPREFSFEYTINDQVRILIRCRTTVAPLKAQYLIQLLPPVSAASVVPTPLAPPGPPQPKNPLLDTFPPADNYGTLRDVLDYLNKATSHVLAAHGRKLARQWEDRSGTGAAWSTTVDGMEIRRSNNAFSRVRFSLVLNSAKTALDTLVDLTDGRLPDTTNDTSDVVPIENDEDDYVDESEEAAAAKRTKADNENSSAQDTENARNADSPLARPSPPELRVYASWPVGETETSVFRKWVWSATSLAEASAGGSNDLESIIVGCVGGNLKPAGDRRSR
ncbi:RNA polymerase II mediator complex subunit [Sporothrix eucalyptigena]|uniref:Mediator of RNA polymerase II transcription subunit 17 n=1 Tax=Sporothrix eucalyptigena TaxID=1812306 RepID=A0ABP0B493_9PEZI